MPKLRVLTVVQRYNSVSEPWLSRMLAGLGDECVGVAGRTLASQTSDGLRLPFMRLRTRNVLHRILPRSLRKYSPKRPARLIQSFAEKLGADRVLCHYGSIAVEYAEAWDLLKLPLFVYFHGYDMMFDLRDQDGSGRLSHPPDYKDQILQLSKRATFIANSNFSKSRLIEAGVASERIKVNYLGVDPAPFPQRSLVGRPKVLYVGRFVDCKGPDLTIKAFNLLREQGVDAELLMVGDGPMHAKCLALAADSAFAADISIPGSESLMEVKKRFESASVFTMHSNKGSDTHQEEGFGVALLDAMAGGLPVVTGLSGGVSEIVQDGITGFLIEPRNIEAHADRLKTLICNPALATKMGKAGWEIACSKFNQQRSTDGLRRILNTI